MISNWMQKHEILYYYVLKIFIFMSDALKISLIQTQKKALKNGNSVKFNYNLSKVIGFFFSVIHRKLPLWTPLVNEAYKKATISEATEQVHQMRSGSPSIRHTIFVGVKSDLYPFRIGRML